MADYDVPRPELDPNKFYSYTWPGEAPRVVSGTVLSLILKGADPAKLEISEVSTPVKAPKHDAIDSALFRGLSPRWVLVQAPDGHTIELIDEENLASMKQENDEP